MRPPFPLTLEKIPSSGLAFFLSLRPSAGLAWRHKTTLCLSLPCLARVVRFALGLRAAMPRTLAVTATLCKRIQRRSLHYSCKNYVRFSASGIPGLRILDYTRDRFDGLDILVRIPKEGSKYRKLLCREEASDVRTGSPKGGQGASGVIGRRGRSGR